MRRHEVDVLSLVFGLFFLGAAAIWGLSGGALRALRGWPLPALLIGVGVVGLLTAVTLHRTPGDRDETNEPGIPRS